MPGNARRIRLENPSKVAKNATLERLHLCRLKAAWEAIMTRQSKIVSRLDKMLTDAINGNFIEENYDETELSRFESKFHQYIAANKLSAEKIQAEREAIKELVTDISHQTKTPLANICLYTQLLEEICTPGQLPYVQQIRMHTKKLGFLVNALSKISRLESNMIKLRPERAPVSRLLTDCSRYIRGMADLKNITIDIKESGNIWALYDARWTYEALCNLLDNAVKYSPEGSTVTVFAKQLEIFTCISVQDEGDGIPEEEQAQVFKRFYRGKNALNQEGNGIGLYLARIILQREQGYIKVSSVPGSGSCFKVYLLNT